LIIEVAIGVSIGVVIGGISLFILWRILENADEEWFMIIRTLRKSFKNDKYLKTLKYWIISIVCIGMPFLFCISLIFY
jgi:hypothetical protein